VNNKILLLIFITFVLCAPSKIYPQELKKSEFAGAFYPADKDSLNLMLEGFLREAEVPNIEGEILGIISPHAGYVYSGPVAAYSYKILESKQFDAVILLGPSHRYYFEGISVYPAGYFATPLGTLEVDDKVAQEFKTLKFVKFEPDYFKGEHSLEVQLPFLEKVLDKPKIVPIIFGKLTYEDLKEIGHKLTDISLKKKILVIVSTDLSHYHPYDEALKIDSKTLDFIKNKEDYSLAVSEDLGDGRACGISGLIAFIIYSKEKAADIKILKYANSGDTAGDKSRVVGYMSAVAFVPKDK
jgi:hypothetical protein